MWKRQGLVEGRDFYESFAAPQDDSPQALERLAREVVASRPDVILTNGYSQTLAFMSLTREIPIVFCCVSDPESVVASLRRPGGNVTGSSSGIRELRLKLLEVVREALPSARRVAFFNDLEPGEGTESWLHMAMAGQAGRLGMELLHIGAARRRTPEDLVATLCEARTDAFLQHSTARIDWAQAQRRCRVPGFGGSKASVELGMLAGLGPPPDEDPHESAIALAARVVRGESPAVIPVTQPLRVHLSVNQRTARELGVELPASLLARADHIVR